MIVILAAHLRIINAKLAITTVLVAVYFLFGRWVSRQQVAPTLTRGNILLAPKSIDPSPQLSGETTTVNGIDFPHYEYKYNIGDHKTGDYKSLRESRSGAVTKGEFSVRGPDGIIRRTEYTVDKNSGYKAVLTQIKPEEMDVNEVDTSGER